MNFEKKITAIIPVYNCEENLTKCVNSILNQSYKNFELILVDDGSKDSSGKICDTYQEKDKRVKVIHQKNSGVSSARNKGIDEAEGKYICFFDSDDYVDQYFFEYSLSIFEKYNVDLVNTGFYSEVEDGEVITSDKIFANAKLYHNCDELKKDLIYLWDQHMLYNVWNKVYLKEIIDKNNIKFPNYNFGEDMDFNKIYLKYVTKFYNSDKCFYHYIKERKGSLTAKYNEKLFEIRLKEYSTFNKYFEQQGILKDDYIEFSSRRFIERILGCIENICSSDITNKEKKVKIKEIVNNETTRETLKYAKPKTKKIKIMLFPIKIKSVYLTYALGYIVKKVRKFNPTLFNKLKNSR